MGDAFEAGSGLTMATVYGFFSGIIVVAIVLWAAWVMWSSWKSVQLKRLDTGNMISTWIQVFIIVAVLVVLVIL
ncbi:MAG: DUF3262 family protein [Gammaproteobacteria bacterium]|nr:DUF3262 family protein [Gammaproteobacteria bacterium]